MYRQMVTVGQKCPAGKLYKNESKMCTAYGVVPAVYNQRLAAGWSIEEALGIMPKRVGKLPKHTVVKEKKNFSEEIHCPNGRVHYGVHSMCSYYDIDFELFRRLKETRGWSTRQALGIDPKPRAFIGPDGFKYTTLNDMANIIGVYPATVVSRLRDGSSLADAIKQDESMRCIVPKKRSVDHLGVSFAADAAMYDYWVVNSVTASERLRSGWTLEQVLSAPPREIIVDHKGYKFNSLSAMCHDWHVSPDVYKSRLKKGMTVEEALTLKVIKPVKISIDKSGEFMGVPFETIFKVLGVSNSQLRDCKKDLGLFIRDTLLWKNPDFLGYTDDEHLLVSLLDGVVKIELSNYIDRMS